MTEIKLSIQVNESNFFMHCKKMNQMFFTKVVDFVQMQLWSLLFQYLFDIIFSRADHQH